MRALVSSRKTAFRVTITRDGDRSIQVRIEPGRNSGSQLVRALRVSAQMKEELDGEQVIDAILASPMGANLARNGVLEVKEDRPVALGTPAASPPRAPGQPPVRPPVVPPAPPADPDRELADGTDPMPWEPSMRVDDLRAALESRGIDPKDMKKADLLQALEAWDATNAEDIEPDATGSAS